MLSKSECSCSESLPAEARVARLWRDYQQALQGDVKASFAILVDCFVYLETTVASFTVTLQVAKAGLSKFSTCFKETFHDWQGVDEVMGEQSAHS